MTKYIPYIVFFLLILYSPVLYSQDTIYMSKEEWEIRRDDYAVQIIVLMRKLEKINSAIDSIAFVDSAKNNELNKMEDELYAAVGLTRTSVEDFRKKFEITESKITGRVSSPDDARLMYYDEISQSLAVCLPEFSERYNSMKKHLQEWEGFQPFIAESKQEEKTELEQQPPREIISVQIAEKQSEPVQETASELTNPKERTYTVVRGDCLRTIARNKYNSSDLWPLIWLANKDGIVNAEVFYLDYQRAVIDPNKIYPGQILFLPVVSQKMKIDVESFQKLIKTDKRH